MYGIEAECKKIRRIEESKERDWEVAQVMKSQGDQKIASMQASKSA